jgi:hypothetical protein
VKRAINYFWYMIRSYSPPVSLEPEGDNRLQWGPAVGAGVIAGAILLLVPRGSPWSALTFFSPVIMGRSLPPGVELSLPLVWMLHMAVSIIYSLLITRVVAGLRQQRAILTGSLMGLILYVVNLAIVSIWRRDFPGNEVSVVFTHVVFGLIAAGAYRGLLKRKAAQPASQASVQ